MKETVSQQWKREYFATQQELNAVTQEVANFVDDFNREVQQMYSSGRSTPDIRSTIDRHIMILDGMWPYHGQSLHVSGKWIGSTVHVENGIDSFSARSIPEEKEVFERALSAGFGIQLKDGYPKYGYYFYLEKEFEEEENAQGVVGLNSYSWGSLGIQYRPAYLAFPSDVTLHPDDNIATPATDLDEVHTGLELAQAQYQLYTRHHESGFYRMGSARQAKLLRGLAAAAADALPSPESNTELRLDAHANAIYLANDPSADSVFVKFQAKRSHPIFTEGVVTDILNLNTLVRSKQGIRHVASVDDLVDPENATCLAVAIEGNDKIIYVPYSDTHESLTLSLHNKYYKPSDL